MITTNNKNIQELKQKILSAQGKANGGNKNFRYDASIKKEVVKTITDGGDIKTIAQDLGISPQSIFRWLNKPNSHNNKNFKEWRVETKPVIESTMLNTSSRSKNEARIKTKSGIEIFIPIDFLDLQFIQKLERRL